MLDNPIRVTSKGMYDMGEVECIYTNDYKKIFTMFDYVDACTGGLIMGDVSLLSGRTGSGKSEFINQLAVGAIQQGHKVLVYSGEIVKERHLSNILCKIVGSKHIEQVKRKLYDGREASKYFDCKVKPYAEEKARTWIKDRYFICDNSKLKGNVIDGLLEAMRRAYNEHGVNYFIIDNLMTVLAKVSSRNMLDVQTDFTNQLVEFASTYNVHVSLVAHPRKSNGSNAVDTDIVAGSSNIVNLVSLSLFISRTTEDEKREFLNKGKDAPDSFLICTKNRTTGDCFKMPLFFNKLSKTFSSERDKEPCYTWDRAEQFSLIDSEFDDLPF